MRRHRPRSACIAIRPRQAVNRIPVFVCPVITCEGNVNRRAWAVENGWKSSGRGNRFRHSVEPQLTATGSVHRLPPAQRLSCKRRGVTRLSQSVHGLGGDRLRSPSRRRLSLDQRARSGNENLQKRLRLREHGEVAAAFDDDELFPRRPNCVHEVPREARRCCVVLGALYHEHRHLELAPSASLVRTLVRGTSRPALKSCPSIQSATSFDV